MIMKQECLKIRAFKGTVMFIQLWSGLHPFILYHFIPHPSSHQAMTEYVGSTSQDHTYCTATGGSTAGEYPRELDTHGKKVQAAKWPSITDKFKAVISLLYGESTHSPTMTMGPSPFLLHQNSCNCFTAYLQMSHFLSRKCETSERVFQINWI